MDTFKERERGCLIPDDIRMRFERRGDESPEVAHGFHSAALIVVQALKAMRACLCEVP